MRIADQIQDLRQEYVFDFRAEINIALLDVFFRRELLHWRSARDDVDEILTGMRETVMQPFENEMHPETTGFEIDHA